ncbi:MAG: hypothetical protein JXA42_23985 [Anaerolineales bacterium]|nr:hypothetical protein [Anaerolineales bacterium]
MNERIGKTREEKHNTVQPTKECYEQNQPARPDGGPQFVLQLQRTHGNKAVQRMIGQGGVTTGMVQRETIEGDLNIGGNLNVGGKISKGAGKEPPTPEVEYAPTDYIAD